MQKEQRQKQIIKILTTSDSPLSGTEIANKMGVSRQVIVQDIAILRANGWEILSTNRGYVLQEAISASRVFKMFHTDERAKEELETIVDCGGRIEDIFVYHKVYGVIRAGMNIKSRFDIENYMKEIASGKSKLLHNVTSGYHYHTVEADNEQILDLIMEKLTEKGFLAKLQDYEPVDFWGDDE